jgi:hypothetical protein
MIYNGDKTGNKYSNTIFNSLSQEKNDNIKRNNLIKCLIYAILLIFLILNIISLFDLPNFNLGDHWIYREAIERYLNNGDFYEEYFAYFPSFFLLSFLVYDTSTYAIFLIVSSILCFLFLLILEEDNKYLAYFFGFTNIIVIFGGNIDVFIFLVILICYWKKENALIAILLAFISFKPTVIIVLPIFLFLTENRRNFIIFYIISFSLFNFYIILHLELINSYLNIVVPFYVVRFDFLRPIWIWYSIYYCLKTFKERPPQDRRNAQIEWKE